MKRQPQKPPRPTPKEGQFVAPRYTRTTWVMLAFATLLILASHALILAGDTVWNVFLGVLAFLVLIPWALLRTHEGD